MLSDIGLNMGACTLWKEKMFLDYTIEVEDEQFKVHKLVMASVSDYFKAMLTVGLVESQTDRVRLEGLSALAVSNIIKFVYTRDFGSQRASATELLKSAEYLQVPAAVEACIQLLSSEMNENNCFDILHALQNYSLKDGIEQTMQYIKSHIEEIIEGVCPNEMTYDRLLNVLEFWPKSEYQLFLSINVWINRDLEKRNQHLNELLSHVRFALMRPEQLADIRDMDIYKASDGGWCELVDKAEEYHKLPTHQKVFDVSDQSRMRNSPLPISFRVDTESLGQFYVLHNNKSWQKHESRLTPHFKAGVDAALVINNFLIVCEARPRFATSPHQAWYMFDPRTLKWSSLAQLVAPRAVFALVHWDKYMYALGGCTGPHDATFTDVIERYDFETNSWTMLLHRLPVALPRLGAAVIGDSIYVAGKRDPSLCRSLTRMDCFNLTTNTWQKKPSLREADYLANKIQKMELWGEEVLFIMDAAMILHWYSPSTEQWSVMDCPLSVHTELIQHADVTILPTPNTLYVVCVFPRSNNRHRNNHAAHGGCAKWTFNARDRTITEVRLDDFPVAQRMEGDYLHALLSAPPRCEVVALLKQQK